MQPASVFIMDVSKSSSAKSGEELSDYLAEIEGWVKEWFKGLGQVQVRHRSGDELIFLANGYSSAYVTAFFLSRIWRYENNKPYFGLAFGSVDKEIDNIDIEKWIHPLVKQARMANDHIKMQKDREDFLFQQDENSSRKELTTLLNGMSKLQHALNLQQTDIQRLVCSLYLIYEKQNIVAELLKRSAPTIYSHYKKGHSELVIGSYREIASVLAAIQYKEFEKLPKPEIRQLEESIQNHVKGQAGNVLNL